MLSKCCTKKIEPCLTDTCEALGVVTSLWPSGALWRHGNGNTIENLNHWLADILSGFMGLICRSQKDLIPCESVDQLHEWAKVYNYPSCVELTSEKFCEWLNIIHSDCSRDSVGFIKSIVNFVNPNVTVTFNNVGKALSAILREVRNMRRHSVQAVIDGIFRGFNIRHCSQPLFSLLNLFRYFRRLLR